MEIPEGADGDAMRRVLADGSDATRPMTIDFMVACPDPSSAEEIANLAEVKGYEISISVDQENDSVTCYCTKEMFLDHAALIAAQEELDELATPHGGYSDGWGTFGNAPEEE